MVSSSYSNTFCIYCCSKKLGFDAIHEHEKALTEYAYEQMSSIEGLEIYGPPFNHFINGCAQWCPALTATPSVSTAVATSCGWISKEDVDQLVEALKQTKEFFSYEF
jgi:cysteine desulfurase/selenocysteine lyase